MNTKTESGKSEAPRCPDFAAIVRTSSSDDSLFAQIAECFSKRLEDYAVYYCKDHHMGKDAFQEAMITALTKLDTYRGDSPVEPWLRRIVVSSCSRMRRGKKNDTSIHSEYDGTDAGVQYADDAPDQEWSLMMARGFESLRLEMENLKEPNRSLLIAHDMHEESISELAEQFDMTQDAVKSRLKRARAQVREALLGHEPSL